MYLIVVVAMIVVIGAMCMDASFGWRKAKLRGEARTSYRSTYMTNDDSHLNIEGHFRMAKGPVAKWLENLFVD